MDVVIFFQDNYTVDNWFTNTPPPPSIKWYCARKGILRTFDRWTFTVFISVKIWVYGTLVLEHQSVEFENRSKKTRWNTSQLVFAESGISIWRRKGCMNYNLELIQLPPNALAKEGKYTRKTEFAGKIHLSQNNLPPPSALPPRAVLYFFFFAN